MFDVILVRKKIPFDKKVEFIGISRQTLINFVLAPTNKKVWKIINRHFAKPPKGSVKI